MLVNAANYDQSSKCKCLELTTDCLMNLNEEYPELESILEGLGVVQKTSYLLPVSIWFICFVLIEKNQNMEIRGYLPSNEVLFGNLDIILYVVID